MFIGKMGLAMQRNISSGDVLTIRRLKAGSAETKVRSMAPRERRKTAQRSVGSISAN